MATPGEKFGYFLKEDPNTLPLSLPVLPDDLLAIVRGTAPDETTYSVEAAELAGLVIVPVVVTPSTGDTVEMGASDRALYVNTGILADLTIKLPPTPVLGEQAELCFAAEVTTLDIQDSAGVTVPTAPINGFGPGSAIYMRYVDSVIGWVYWK